MYIAILVLLGLAVAIWYTARKQNRSAFTPTQENKPEYQIDPNADLFTAATEPTSIPTSPSVEQIDTVLAETPKPAKKKRRYYPKKK